MKHQTYNFCTLFDSYYLTKGLILYDSLEQTCTNFHLYVFAFDEVCYTKLIALALPNMTVISLLEFENEDLLRIKPTRNKAEYCWTCGASSVWYAIHQFQLDHCVYLDADLRFFDSPKIAFDQIGDASIAITEHFIEKDDPAGRFCVQFVYFNNDKNGMKALEWWKNSCIDWCFARYEDGKFGDQKYLDSFPLMFDQVYIFTHRGIGVAPWNMKQYKYVGNNQLEYNGQIYPIVFFHYHGIRVVENRTNYNLVLKTMTYDLTESVESVFFIPFLIAYKEVCNKYLNIQVGELIIENRNKYQIFYSFLKKVLKRNRLARYFYYRVLKVKYNGYEQQSVADKLKDIE